MLLRSLKGCTTRLANAPVKRTWNLYGSAFDGAKTVLHFAVKITPWPFASAQKIHTVRYRWR
jgi:hypothetical protein